MDRPGTRAPGGQPRIAIRLFGPFEVRVEGGAPARFRSRKSRWLLALRHGREVERDWLVGLLWPDDGEKQSYASLRQCLTDVRRALGAEGHRLRTPSPHTLCLDLSGAEVDLLRFDEGLARGDAPSLATAVTAYSGPLLEGCIEEWALPEQRARVEAYLGALEKLAAATAAGGQPESAAHYLRLAVVADPLRESGQRALMEQLAAGGSYAAATLAYRDLRLHLHREMNCEPAPETRALYEQIRVEAREKAQLLAGSGNGVGPARKGEGEKGRVGDLDFAPSPTLPTGTLTFLLTDIEDSSGLLERHGEAMRHALQRHNQLIDSGVTRHGGIVNLIQGEGDSVLAVFSRPMEALDAACALQRALQAEAWPIPEPLRVRMALYTGAAELVEGRYRGIAIHRCARLRELARGGQILVGESSHDVARDETPPQDSSWALRDLGVYRLRGLSRPERIYQLQHPELPAAPADLSVRPIGRGKLPQLLTSLVGRESEVQEIRARLASARLVTLTGSGGVGKTRLAIQVAEEVEGNYLEGAWFVDLAPVSDPMLVVQAVASTLDVREEPGQPLIESIVAVLRPRSLLLLLDNCEHLLDACARLAETLLCACPNLRILATSRQALGLTGEVVWRVPSLAVPPGAALQGSDHMAAAALARCAAVRLFLERGIQARADFRPTEENVRAAAGICRRLDGIPLAIELAAARVKSLSVEQIAERLDDRFRLLTGGSRTSLPRHQTLRALIDWSNDLLSTEEKLLLRCLSSFAGGWTLEAAEAVCALRDEGGRMRDEGPESGPTHPSSLILHPSEVLDLLASLVDKSLVIYEEEAGAPASPGRYRMLETLREYAQEQLASEEGGALARRHAEYFLAVAEQAEARWRGPEEGAWLERLEIEHDNLRAALEWSLSKDEGGRMKDEAPDPGPIHPSSLIPHPSDAGLRLAAALWRFWYVRGYFDEGKRWLARVPVKDLRAPPALRAKALTGLGAMAWMHGEYQQAAQFHGEALALYRRIGDRRGTAFSLNNIAVQAQDQGDDEAARPLYEESLALYRDLEDAWGMAFVKNNLGLMSSRQGDYETARLLFEESITAARVVGDRDSMVLSLYNLGEVAQRQGDLEGAQRYYRETLGFARELGCKQAIVFCLEGLAATEADWTDPPPDTPARAARLFGAAAALREAILRHPMHPLDRVAHERDVAVVRALIDEREYAAVVLEGQAMTLDQAVAYALEECPEERG